MADVNEVLQLSAAKRDLLAKLLEQATRGGRATERIPRRADPGREPSRPSAAQERLWFLEHLSGADPVNNMAGAVRFTGPLDVQAMIASIDAIIARHEVLRTRFEDRDGAPMAVASAALALEPRQVDLRDHPASDREARAQAIMAEEARSPFDLAKGPLIRAVVIRLDEQEWLCMLALHHAVADGVSTRVLFGEMTRLYRGFVTGQRPQLPELPIQYADYAAWQRSSAEDPRYAHQLAYWRRKLGGGRLVLELPTDHPRPPRISSKGARVPLRVPADVADAMRERCRILGVTPFMFLMSAFTVLLHRYTGQHDVNVGTAVAGRNRPELRELIGCFLNMLVIRTDLTGNPTVRDVVKQTQSVLLEAYEHQDVPFERVVEALNPERDMSHQPLYQVLLSLEDAPVHALTLRNLTVQFEEIDTNSAKADLVLDLTVDGRELAGWFEYRTELFRRSTIERMTGHFLAVLRRMAEDLDGRIGDIDLLGDDERALLLTQWNATAAPYPRDRCIHELIEQWASSTPAAVAAVDPRRSLTYGELNARANQLARHLQALGVRAETPVGVAMDRSVDLVVSLLAILKAGGTYVPLDARYPPDRLKFMMEDAQIALLVTSPGVPARLPAHGARVLVVDDLPREAAALPADDLPRGVGPENRAYIIYTSGSTGRPKGVEICHRGLCNTIAGEVRSIRVGPGNRMLQFASLSFDASAWEIFTALTSGAALHLADAEALAPGAPLFALLRDQRITHALLPPSVVALLPREPLEELATLVVGGEACPTEIMAAWSPGRRFINAYGPTENTIIGTTYVCSGESERPLIGRPIANVQTYILDPYAQPVPIGVPGELFLGGESLARGYLGRPELTAQRFVTWSAGAGPKIRLYRTGDLARYLPDGNIEFLGRADDQVKVHGYRIELGEIEDCLKSHPWVVDCAVMVRQDGGADKRLVAYVVCGGDPAPTPSALKDHVLGTLPTYMLPAAFVFLPELPLSPNGKIDRRALPAPQVERAEFAEPRTDAEVKLAAIWGEVLGVERVGAADNFFELGGDSILSLQVVAKARKVGLHIEPNQVFRFQTVQELAAAARPAPAQTADQGVVVGDVPLTAIQRWFFEQELEGPERWNQAVVWEAAGVDGAALERALASVWSHHDALRLTFPRTGAGVKQLLAGAEGPPALARIDLRGTSRGALERSLERELDALHAGFDLELGPLLRAALIQTDGPRQYLALVAHHLVVDGVSWRILFEDLEAAYLAERDGRTPALPAKTASFKAWAEAVVAHSASRDVAEEAGYWRDPARAHAPLPVDAAGGNTVASARTLARSLAPDETALLLREVTKAYHTQVGDALLAALGQALAAWAGRGRYAILVEGHGREPFGEPLDVSRTVGWFTSAYPVVLDVARDRDPGEALRHAKEQVRAIPHRGFGYGLLRHLAPDEATRALLRAEPEISFNYLGQLDQSFERARVFAPTTLRTGRWRSAGGRRPRLLEIDAVVRDGALAVECTYGDRHEEATVSRFLDGLVGALREIVRHCTSRAVEGYTPSDFGGAGLSQEELDELLGQYG